MPTSCTTDRILRLGVGMALDAVITTPGQVRDAVADVLEDPGMREAIHPLRREIAAHPDPGSAVPVLEQLGDGVQRS